MRKITAAEDRGASDRNSRQTAWETVNVIRGESTVTLRMCSIRRYRGRLLVKLVLEDVLIRVSATEAGMLFLPSVSRAVDVVTSIVVSRSGSRLLDFLEEITVMTAFLMWSPVVGSKVIVAVSTRKGVVAMWCVVPRPTVIRGDLLPSFLSR